MINRFLVYHNKWEYQAQILKTYKTLFDAIWWLFIAIIIINLKWKTFNNFKITHLIDVPTRRNRSLHRTDVRHWKDMYNENVEKFARSDKTKCDFPWLVPLCYIGMVIIAGIAITLLVLCCLGLMCKIETCTSSSYEKLQNTNWNFRQNSHWMTCIRVEDKYKTFT